MAEPEYRRLGCAMDGCAGSHKAKGLCLRHYRQDQRGGVRQDPTHCKQCQEPLTAVKAGVLYCSNRCKVAAWKAANPDRNILLRQRHDQPKLCAYYAKHCEVCGTAGGRRTNWAICGPCLAERTKAAAREARHAMALARHKATGRVVACGGCGCEFCPLYGASQATLCAPCAAGRKAAQTKAAKKFRKALKRGAAGGETFDEFEILERDGWRCRLCGIATPRELRGTYEHNAPEVDHITPVARGGKHVRSNAQCLCRSCNGWKSDRTMEEVEAALA